MRRLSTVMLMGMAFLGACAATSENDDATSEAPLQPAPPFAGDTANQAPFGVDISMWELPMAQSEMDCFWASGVRHVVVGTQVEDIAREQLAMAVSRGMSVDAYVYLYWDKDVTAQVQEAFKRVAGFPITRMWLDVEQSPGGLGANTLIADVQQGLDACNAHGGVGCGIYTGPGFWKSYMNDTKSFANVPLWYAQYNYRTSLSDWSTEHFGGWAKPVAKQFATKPLCGVGGPDWDVMQLLAPPTVIVDRTLPPDTKQPPPAPAGLYPADGAVVPPDYVKIMSATIPRATSYQLALERWNGSSFTTYYTWTNANAFQKVAANPVNSLFRFRARAANAYGWGAWSAWSSFDYGKYTGTRPNQAPPPPSPNPPPASGVPGSLAPDGGALLGTTSVTLSFSAVASASTYDVAIEYGSGNAFQSYVTYSGAATARTFYPAVHGTTYRWRARAKVGTTFGDWSAYATFQYK